MNKHDRRQIQDITEKLDEQATELDRLGEDQTEKYDNLPEGLQVADAGERLEDAASQLDEQACTIREIIDTLREL